MIRIIVALLVLGLGAVAWVLLLPETRTRGPEPAQPSPTVAASAALPKVATVATPSDAGREIRVVYPGPDATASVRKIADKVAAEPGPAPVAATAAPTPVAPPPSPAPAAPAPVSPAPATVALAAPASPTAPAPSPAGPSGSGQTVNINTASIDALNQLPGVGHIGRTIASHRPYGSIEELVSRRVLRKSVYDRIKDQIAAN